MKLSRIEKKRETIFIHKWLYHICRLSTGIYKKFLALINKFSKVTGYKINIKKINCISTQWYEQSKNEIKKAIPFTVASKRIKYLD